MKGKLVNGVGIQYSSHYLGTWRIQHYYRWCAHLGCQWLTEPSPPPGRFKWTRLFCRKTKSGFCVCVCVITFQLASTTIFGRSLVEIIAQRLASLRFSIVSISLLEHFDRMVCHDVFYYSLFIFGPMTQHYVVWDADSAVRWLIYNTDNLTFDQKDTYPFFFHIHTVHLDTIKFYLFTNWRTSELS